ncbi:MAG: tetratricopeptide repeat protein [Xanthomonadales bacterium]|nr:tetratricopeptide repeat protein [Xanthomonadales bacterium]
MLNLRNFCALLLFLGLISCDDQTTKPATELQQSFNANTQAISGVELLKSQLAMNPNDFNLLSQLGDTYFESGQYFDAILIYDRAIAVNPMCADCYNDKGLASHYVGDTQTAIESFDKAVEINPEFTHAWLSKGFVLASVGRYQEAIAPLNRVKELDGAGSLAAEADKFLAMVAERGGQ